MSSNSKLKVAACCGIPLAFAALVGAQHHGPKAKPKPKLGKVPFSTVATLIKTRCELCHNAKRHAANVDLSSYGAIMKKGRRSPLVVPGAPDKSDLILIVDGHKQPRMPLRSAPLSEAEIASLKKWVAAGAKA